MSTFDDRWRELARHAAKPAMSSLPDDLARRARLRQAEPIPFVTGRWTAALAASAALLTALLLPLALDEVPAMDVAAVTRPPALPPPPGIESPGHYLSLARSAWKDLTP